MTARLLLNLSQTSACLKRCLISPSLTHCRRPPHCLRSFSQAAQGQDPTEHASQTSPESDDEESVPQSAGVPFPFTSQAPLKELDPSSLYIVPTPIGNLQDITLRALHVLQASSLVLAEDTRHTRKLLNYFGLKAELMSCHDHNEKQRVAGVIQRLKEGQSLAMVSDAGMPGISDPGHALITAAIEAGVQVIPLPGPCAFVCALVASGLPTTSFTFHGFLSPKSVARRARLSELRDAPETLVFYAPPHGLVKVLADMAAVLGGVRRVCVARELTKIHEELYRSTLQGALDEFSQREPRGEICIVLEGATESNQGLSSAETAADAGDLGAVAQTKVAVQERARPLLLQLISSGVPMSAAAKQAAKQLGVSRKELYDVAMQVQAEVRTRPQQSSEEPPSV